MTPTLWTAAEVVAATQGSLVGAEGFSATGIGFDTRDLLPGDLFFALSGTRDGHDFVSGAFAAGAAAALVERPIPGGPCVVVPNVMAALEQLGAYARDRAPQCKRGVVTGSVGKTSVTQLVKAGLDLAGPAHSSIKSFNNHIGVPLTLARLPRAAERAVFEIGMNHADEIRPLSKMVQPLAALVTTVGPVHTENFEDGVQGVARAKAEVFEGLCHQGLAILPSDNDFADYLRSQALHHHARVASFGIRGSSDARLVDYAPEGTGARVHARIWGVDHIYTLRQQGMHHALNSLGAALMLEELEVEIGLALEAISAFEALSGRGLNHRLELATGGTITLIDESYNANPLSMRAAMGNLSLRQPEAGGRRIAVLTDMLELGVAAQSMHAQLAEVVVQNDVDLVYCAGPLMRHLHEALPATRRGGYADQATGLVADLLATLRPGDVVMVKGSNGSKAHEVSKALMSSGQVVASKENGGALVV